MGNRTQVAEVLAQVGGGSSTPSTSYNYDKLYRLTGVTGPSGTTTYSYDPLGNRASKILDGATTSYTYDRADRITSAGSTSYTVNANGNETARGTDSFSYDQANQLKSATVTGTTGTYMYDGDGKRTSKTIGGVTTSYVYDVSGGLPVLLDDGSRKYVWGASGLTYSVDKASGAVQVYHTDGLGSVRAISDSSGSVVQTYQTDEFGGERQTGGTSTQSFGYTGEQSDSESGLLYLRARIYDASTGRFMQRDTFRGLVVAPPSLNQYVYTANNPLIFTDHSGRTFSRAQEQTQSTDCSNLLLSIANPICQPQFVPKEQAVILKVVQQVRIASGLPGIAMMPKIDPNDYDEDSGPEPIEKFSHQPSEGDMFREALKLAASLLGQAIKQDQLERAHDVVSKQGLRTIQEMAQAIYEALKK